MDNVQNPSDSSVIHHRWDPLGTMCTGPFKIHVMTSTPYFFKTRFNTGYVRLSWTQYPK
jgi:hypothetical protein